MSDLKLQSRTQESRSKAWQSMAPTPVEEKPKKHVRFNIDNELGGQPTLPLSMTLFLAEGETIKPSDAPISATTGPTDSQWPNLREDPQ